MEKNRDVLGRENKKTGISRRTLLIGVSAVAGATLGGVMAHRAFSPKETKTDFPKKTPTLSPEKIPTSIDRVHAEIEHARILLSSKDPLDVLKSTHLVSALYYSDRFLASILKSSDTPDESHEIVRGIVPHITTDVRRRYVEALSKEAYRAFGERSEEKRSLPFPKLDFGRGDNHPDAVDIFAREGTKIASVRRGVVVLAESGWTEKNPYLGTSPRGGNTAIVFNQDSKQFYRYAHLDRVSIRTGEVIGAGHSIGTVGRTGINAFQNRSASHVHLEINAYTPATQGMRSLSSHEVKQEIQKINSNS